MNYQGDLGLNSLSSRQHEELNRLRIAIADHFHHRQNLIDRSNKAALHAADLLQYIDADIMVTLVSSHFFEIGFETAHRWHGDLYERFLGQENIKAAGAILSTLTVDTDFATEVCELVSSIYGQAVINTPEFRITWDAMNLIKCTASVTLDREQLKAHLNRLFQTEPGYRRACAQLL